MNERIKQMARQSGATDQNGSMATTVFCFTEMELEKFAELLIKECMMLCGAVSGAAKVTRPNDAFGEGAEKCQVLIKEHFGIDK